MLSPVPVAGIDAGKHFLDLGFHSAARPLRPTNDPAGREDGKPAKVAIVATGRRLVVLANALIREDKTFAESNICP